MPQVDPTSIAYVLLKTETAAADAWTAQFVRNCVHALGDSYSSELIDEQYLSEGHDVSSLALKVEGPNAFSQVDGLLPELLCDRPAQINVRVVEADNDAQEELSGLQLVFFRREFAVDSAFVHHVESCVKLIHQATGTVVRSTCYRSREKNHQEALLLMRSILVSDKQ